MCSIEVNWRTEGPDCDPCSGPVSWLSQDVAEDRVPQAGETVQNVVNSRSRKIAVKAAISAHSVAVKPFSFFSSRRKIPNIPCLNYWFVRGKPKMGYGSSG